MMSSCVLRLLLNGMSIKSDSTCRKVGEKMRRPARHAIIIHRGAKLSRIAAANTLTDSNNRFLEKTRPFLNSVTRTARSIPYSYKLPKYNPS